MSGSGGNSSTEKFYNTLLGVWKRNLVWIEFGGTFQHFRHSNTIVFCEKYDKMDKETDALYMKWSVGRNLNRKELNFHYVMKFTPRSNGETMLECKVNGTTCYGKYVPKTETAVINFFLRDKTSVLTYRLDDKDYSETQQMPTIQYGTMYKLDKSLYDKEIYGEF